MTWLWSWNDIGIIWIKKYIKRLFIIQCFCTKKILQILKKVHGSEWFWIGKVCIFAGYGSIREHQFFSWTVRFVICAVRLKTFTKGRNLKAYTLTNEKNRLMHKSTSSLCCIYYHGLKFPKVKVQGKKSQCHFIKA